MFISERTLDDLMNEIIGKLLLLPFDLSPTKGKNCEIFGVLLELTNPRARLSISETRGKAFSAIGEFLWYMSKSNSLDFIEYYISDYKKYSDDGETIYGAYGPRLFNMNGKYNQVENVINLLREKQTTRKAVIQLFDAQDLENPHNDIPCTCTLQFVIRNNKLNLLVTMRSNDAFLGLPHDIFSFTMLQEIVASDLKVDLGTYRHAVGSLHLYKNNEIQARQYIKEGYQSQVIMPVMESEEIWGQMQKLLIIEEKIRKGDNVNISEYNLQPYWSDLAYLLKIFSFQKNNDYERMYEEKENILDPIYKPYIDKKIKDGLNNFAKK